MDEYERTVAYHQRTKHHPHQFARSLGFLDWESQPDPFLHYDGAEVIALDRGPFETGVPFDALDRAEGRSVATLDRRSLSDLLFHSLAVSAWKEFEESRWSLRVNPSSGNLHPTEAYVVVGPVEGVTTTPGVFHYRADRHELERRRQIDGAAWGAVLESWPDGTFFVGLSSIPWREAWKYGERAFRYVQHDVGHAMASIAVAARVLGWDARSRLQLTDDELGALLRTETSSGPEREHADLLLAIGPAGKSEDLDPAPIALSFVGDDTGVRRPLSGDHQEWPVIDDVAAATGKGAEMPARAPIMSGPAPSSIDGAIDARALVRGRRSAVDMDGETAIDVTAFARIVARARPTSGTTPWATLPWRPAIHAFFFVHRVDGLAPGLYLLPRDPDAIPALRAACHERFAWTEVAEVDGLLRLEEKDLRGATQNAACGQTIAGDGCFAVAMVGEFAPRLAEEGAWFYRALHWEAGALGQVLYLEAEAAGIRATGIGCFFDDNTHAELGLRGTDWQTIYWFTVGGPVEDTRLVTRPAYD